MEIEEELHVCCYNLNGPVWEKNRIDNLRNADKWRVRSWQSVKNVVANSAQSGSIDKWR
jgi:hypothetical protein